MTDYPTQLDEMKPVVIKWTVSIDEEIDDCLYGGYYLHTREHGTEGAPYVQVEKGGEWIPVVDWKEGYKVNAMALRRIARHFIELGKQMEK